MTVIPRKRMYWINPVASRAQLVIDFLHTLDYGELVHYERQDDPEENSYSLNDHSDVVVILTRTQEQADKLEEVLHHFAAIRCLNRVDVRDVEDAHRLF